MSTVDVANLTVGTGSNYAPFWGSSHFSYFHFYFALHVKCEIPGDREFVQTVGSYQSSLYTQLINES